MLNPRVDRRTVSRRALLGLGACCVALTIPVSSLRAGQAVPTALSGSIYDPSGGVLPGVALTLEDSGHVTRPLVTDAAGHFVLPDVQPGRYILGASLPGFRTLRAEFELRDPRDWDRAITLQVGAVSETVTVRETRVAAPSLPSQPQQATRIRVGGNIRPPQKLVDVRPVYPAAMRAAGREGVVPLEAVIGIDGTVSSVRVLSAQVHPDFAIAAVDAVRQWRFSPTLLNGTPVEVVMTVTMNFNLAN